MRKLSTVLLLMLLALTVACSPKTEETVQTTNDPSAEVAEPTDTPQPAPTDTPEPAPTDTPEPAPTETPVEMPMANLTDECVADYNAEVDYFPQKMTVDESEGFTIDYFNNYKVLTVAAPFPGADPATYILVQCGTPAPEGFDNASVIEVPISSFVSMSTTYLPYLDQFGLLDKLVGLDSFAYAYNQNVRNMADAGELVELGSGATVNVESAIELAPDLVMTFASGSPDYDTHPKLQEAGIPFALNADYLDNSPLGRAEWGKYIAAFFNADDAAQTWFDDVSSQYTDLITLAADVEERPAVFFGTPFDGTWYMAGGASYPAQIATDAGAAYPWSDDDSTGSLFLDFETVFDKAADADFWLNLGFIFSADDLVATDERFGDFAAFQNGNLYNNDARTNEFGGNDFFEGAGANPHLVLADLIKIFHPELLPDHEFVYYHILQ